MAELDLAALLCSRLCHDLIGPVGAIANGVEFLQMEDDDEMQEQAMGLLAGSAADASAKLQLFRIALGAGASAGNVGLTEAGKLVEKYYANSKVAVEWPGNGAGDETPKEITKLALNLAVIGGDLLPRGGTMSVAVEDGRNAGGGFAINFSCQGQGAKMRADIGPVLEGNVPLSDITPRESQAFYTLQLINSLSGKIEFQQVQDDLVVLKANIV